MKDNSENIVLDEERVVGRTKDERLIERLRVIVVGLKTNREKINPLLHMGDPQMTSQESKSPTRGKCKVLGYLGKNISILEARR